MKQTIYFEKVSPFKIWRVARSIKKCNSCGNKKVGNGEGTFEINHNHIKRTCKCGNEVVIGKASLN